MRAWDLWCLNEDMLALVLGFLVLVLLCFWLFWVSKCFYSVCFVVVCGGVLG